MSDEKEKPETGKSDSAAAAERGKKATDASKVNSGKDPADPKVQEEEKKDAENWRNEG